MQLFSITQLLSCEGLADPDLRVLKPNNENYTALLLQPQGDIDADTNGVHNRDRELAKKQFSAFLQDAILDQADLAITPEYSMPWQVIETSLRTGVVPVPSALWVLGCESITRDQLGEFRDSVADVATVLYENLDSEPGRFLDPVLYIFSSRPMRGDDNLRLVIVVQFKTSPMADPGHFETNGLQLGTRLYYFGNGSTQLRLATIICSDAFDLLDAQARQLYDRTLVIHIQLNPKPRQTEYRRYRARLMCFANAQTELICLNWAKDVHESSNGKRKCWHNISGTGWYIKLNGLEQDEYLLAANHKKGLYYTWVDDLRCHALFFTYAPAVFKVIASKLAHIGVPGSTSRRRSPLIEKTKYWDSGTTQWVDVSDVDDGFSKILNESGDAEIDLKSLAATNPFAAERVLALAAGRVHHYDWHNLAKLDSCNITSSEVINRITVCHDTDVDAAQFRTRRLRTANRLTIAMKKNLPAALADLKNGFRLDWKSQSPHTNVASLAGRRATVIYLGDEHTAESAYTVMEKAADHIGQWETTPDDIVEGKQRLHVWYSDNAGNEVQCDPNRYVQYDESHTDSSFDITRSK